MNKYFAARTPVEFISRITPETFPGPPEDFPAACKSAAKEFLRNRDYSIEAFQAAVAHRDTWKATSGAKRVKLRGWWAHEVKGRSRLDDAPR